MDLVMILIFLGFIFTGFLVGYPTGHVLGRREAVRELSYPPAPILRRRRRRDILDADYLEVK